MLEQRARLYRQAIVNSNDHIASSALAAGIQLFEKSPEVVQKFFKPNFQHPNFSK